jgi:hypothetical protein
MRLDSLPRPSVWGQARSTAKRLRSASEQWPRAASWVARKTTRGALPASSASCQRGAQRHQRSPGFRPRKPISGIGVERSLPRDLENPRNAAVMTAQTVWLPMSSRPVSQQPSRKNPVMGFVEQTSSWSPSTLRGALRRPPPLPLSSLRMARLNYRCHPLGIAVLACGRRALGPGRSRSYLRACRAPHRNRVARGKGHLERLIKLLVALCAIAFVAAGAHGPIDD